MISYERDIAYAAWRRCGVAIPRVVSDAWAGYDQDMAIEFLCPNGHALSAPDDRAGRPAKCPKCAVAFRVPEHTAAATRAASTSDSQIRSGGVTEVRLNEAASQSLARSDARKSGAGEEMIVFLCPNGHKLNGPARLRGRPGQCPYCGAKFRIPSADEMEAGDDGDDDESVISDGPNEGHDAGMRVREIPEMGSSAIRRTGGSESAIRPAQGPAWPEIMANLWRHRPPGGAVELHLSDGKSVTPQWYAAALSGPTHGFFGVADGEGSYTLLAIAWASVSRIEVHGVIDLPDEMIS